MWLPGHTVYCQNKKQVDNVTDIFHARFCFLLRNIHDLNHQEQVRVHHMQLTIGPQYYNERSMMLHV